MEFPHLGTNCALTTCKQLDFLPLKCDACSKLFCKEHIKYTEHSCENSYKKDHQVPVCPLCNKPVPVPRGQQPDIKVGEHIDRDCQSDPALAKRKAYLNRCALKGCKQKECVDEICKCDYCKLLSSTDNVHVVSCGAGCYSCNAESVDEKSVDETLIPVRCDSCRQNFCLKHRHEQDHNCSAVVRRSGTGGKTSASVKAGQAATTRAMKSSSSKVNQTKPQQTALSSIGRDLDRSRRERQQQTRVPQSTGIPRPALSEDEALALAIQASLQDQTKTQSTSSPQTTQEEEDRALAQALAESEREERNRRRQQQGQQEKKSDCCVT